jgi:hypothetical protein
MLVEIQNADALSQPSAFNASALTISPLKGPWQDSCFVYPEGFLGCALRDLRGTKWSVRGAR